MRLFARTVDPTAAEYPNQALYERLGEFAGHEQDRDGKLADLLLHVAALEKRAEVTPEGAIYANEAGAKLQAKRAARATRQQTLITNLANVPVSLLMALLNLLMGGVLLTHINAIIHSH